MNTIVTKQDVLLSYDIANWFLRTRPDNIARRGEEYRYDKFQLSVPFYTLPFELTDRVLFSDSTTGVNGFTAKYKDAFVVAFDSSSTNKDWRTNLTYFQKIMPYPKSSKSKVRMHGAYAIGWLQVRDTVHKAFIRSMLKNIIVCGYSMGAGIAPICALDLQYTFNLSTTEIKCVAIGAPRVFNKAGRVSYNNRVPETIRVKWGNDIVTKAPPPLLKFQHIGKELHIGPKEHWWRISFLDHDQGRGAYNSIMYRLQDGPIDPSWLTDCK